MQIRFKNNKLKKLANSDKEARKKLGKQGAKKLRNRLDELDAANTLEDMRSLPAARCHELKGNLKGSLAVDLHGGGRIVFEPDHDPVPTKKDDGMDWRGVEKIFITTKITMAYLYFLVVTTSTLDIVIMLPHMPGYCVHRNRYLVAVMTEQNFFALLSLRQH